MTKIKRKLYILPEWGGRLTDKNYRKLISIARSKRYEIVPVKISTRNRKYSLGSKESLAKITQKIKEQIIKPCSNDTLFGFSIGALQAYQVARYLNIGHVILCSISPILGSDLLSYPKNEVTDLSLSQYKEMSKMNYATLVSKKISLLYGDKESEILKNRCIRLGTRKRYTAIEIKNAGHILDEIYLRAVKKVLFKDTISN